MMSESSSTQRAHEIQNQPTLKTNSQYITHQNHTLQTCSLLAPKKASKHWHHHISPIPSWLLVCFRIDFKIWPITFKARRGSEPPYRPEWPHLFHQDLSNFERPARADEARWFSERLSFIFYLVLHFYFLIITCAAFFWVSCSVQDFVNSTRFCINKVFSIII